MKEPRRWCVTGAAGFIGSHLVEKLLSLNQHVVGVDNFATGKRENLEKVLELNRGKERNFHFIEADIIDHKAMLEAFRGCAVVLHQAALGSVPRSIKDPFSTTQSNVEGFVNVLQAANESGVKRFVYASSSSVYGDSPTLPKVEHAIGKQLSPYALSKYTDELYADLFAREMHFKSIGLRYFNVFGPRQDPNGPYAAVIPRWISALQKGEACTIYGDGETSRDFCFVANAVQANILSGAATNEDALCKVYNVALGAQTSLKALYQSIVAALKKQPQAAKLKLPGQPLFAAFREGDVKHSLADISLAKELLGYAPEVEIGVGLEQTVASML